MSKSGGSRVKRGREVADWRSVFALPPKRVVTPEKQPKAFEAAEAVHEDGLVDCTQPSPPLMPHKVVSVVVSQSPLGKGSTMTLQPAEASAKDFSQVQLEEKPFVGNEWGSPTVGTEQSASRPSLRENIKPVNRMFSKANTGDSVQEHAVSVVWPEQAEKRTEGVEECCPICKKKFGDRSTILDRQVHLNACVDDMHIEPIKRRTYLCVVCGSDQSEPVVGGPTVSKRLQHLKVCAKLHKFSLQDLMAQRYAGAGDTGEPSELDRLLAAVEADEGEEEESSCSTDLSLNLSSDCPRQVGNRTVRGFLSNAFSVLMSKRSSDSTAKESSKSRRQSHWATRTPRNIMPPKPKLVPGAPGFAVDGFDYTAKHYFLTHFHSDHYTCLRASTFNQEATIYCTPATASLIQLKLGVKPEWVREIKIGGPPIIVENVEVSAIDANHCPGAAMFWFKVNSTKKCYLHSGDCRYDKSKIRLTRQLSVATGFKFEAVYLDTTYCNQRYVFLTQATAISEACTRVKAALEGDKKKTAIEVVFGASRANSSLLVFGTYTIGKERLVFAVMDACCKPEDKLWVSSAQMRVLQACSESFSSADMARLTTKKSEATAFVLPKSQLKAPLLEKLLKSQRGRFTRVIAVSATGWHSRVSESCSGNIHMIRVPYSEHSSFNELRDLVADARIVAGSALLRFVPTVNHNSCQPHLDGILKEKISWGKLKQSKRSTEPGAMIKLNLQVLSIGRGSESTIRLHDPSVSKLHAKLFYSDQKAWIQDLSSSFGTFVNKEKISKTPRQLKNGDTVTFGRLDPSLGLPDAPWYEFCFEETL